MTDIDPADPPIDPLTGQQPTRLGHYAIGGVASEGLSLIRCACGWTGRERDMPTHEVPDADS